MAQFRCSCLVQYLNLDTCKEDKAWQFKSKCGEHETYCTSETIPDKRRSQQCCKAAACYLETNCGKK
ncbi:hypothetical protein ACHWQZ_G012000 [Mnemiopsis leidyi]